MSLVTKLALFLVVAALAILAGIQTYTVVHFAQEPMTILKAEADNPEVPVGDDLLVRYSAERTNLCKVDVDFFVLRESDNAVASSIRRPGGVIPLGQSSFAFAVQTSHLKIGRYLLRVFIHNDCGDRLHTSMIPDIPFEVVD